MKTPAEIANHPKAHLHREVVAMLRAARSVEGANQTWVRLRLNARLWKRIVNYGLGLRDRQVQLNKIAFPDANAAEVDAALRAGNSLSRLHDIACGRASVARDSDGNFKVGGRGLKIIMHATGVIRRRRSGSRSPAP